MARSRVPIIKFVYSVKVAEAKINMIDMNDAVRNLKCDIAKIDIMLD